MPGINQESMGEKLFKILLLDFSKEGGKSVKINTNIIYIRTLHTERNFYPFLIV
jgi:hypothetical protein